MSKPKKDRPIDDHRQRPQKFPRRSDPRVASSEGIANRDGSKCYRIADTFKAPEDEDHDRGQLYEDLEALGRILNEHIPDNNSRLMLWRYYRGQIGDAELAEWLRKDRVTAWRWRIAYEAFLGQKLPPGGFDRLPSRYRPR